MHDFNIDYIESADYAEDYFYLEECPDDWGALLTWEDNNKESDLIYLVRAAELVKNIGKNNPTIEAKANAAFNELNDFIELYEEIE